MAGDHKCPYCPATFTRPQHVGRHVRSHTGDRPYECKECPLRFSRSDLLSRHVNKAHREQEPGAGPKKEGKKGRRKSMSTLARQPDKAIGTVGEGGANGNQGPTQAARRASMGQQEPYSQEQQRQQELVQQQQLEQHQEGMQQQQQSQLQAQRMYPNHPLLNNLLPHIPTQQWFPTSAPMTNMYGSPVDTYSNPILTAPPAGGFNIGRSGSMRMSPSDMGPSSSSMGRMESGSSTGSYDYGFKKKACDQCNHSKVKCDFTYPCDRCSLRNVSCSYNKIAKSKSIAVTPVQGYAGMPPVSASPSGNPYTGMPSGSGSSQSPISHFSTSPNMMASSLNQQSFAAHQNPANISTSPVNNMSLGLTTQGNMPYLPVDTWANLNTYLDPSVNSAPGHPQAQQQPQSLGMYIPPTSANSMPPLAPLNTVPIANGYVSQIMNRRESTSQSPHALPLQTPSLISHATSPDSSDEMDRKPSLIGSISSIGQSGHILQKGHSFSSDTSTGGIRISPDSKPVMLPLQVNNDMYANAGYVFDPMYQMRQQPLANSDEETDPLASSTASLFNEPEEPAVTARRRSSLGIYANAFNQMSLQDGSMVNGIVPDPYTAVQFAQQLSAQRPSFPMATLEEGTEPSKVASSTDLKDAWKAYMQDPSAGTPAQEKEVNAGTPSRPAMGRTMSKSNSAPDLTSPSLAHQLPPYAGDGPPQAQIMQHGQTAPSGEMTRDTWDALIAQRQAAFNFQVANKFGRNASGSSHTAMLPPPFNSRPLASIMQHTGALQQTLGPERAPSFGSTPNSEKPNPTSTWSRTPSKLAPRAPTRPGNKRMPSQTLGPEAKKRSSSFSVWDETDEGELGDTEDNTTFGWNGFPNMSYQPIQPLGHGRSSSMSHMGMGGYDLSMFINPNSSSSSTIPMSMMPQPGPM